MLNGLAKSSPTRTRPNAFLFKSGRFPKRWVNNKTEQSGTILPAALFDEVQACMQIVENLSKVILKEIGGEMLMCDEYQWAQAPLNQFHSLEHISARRGSSVRSCDGGLAGLVEMGQYGTQASRTGPLNWLDQSTKGRTVGISGDAMLFSGLFHRPDPLLASRVLDWSSPELLKHRSTP